jgi:2,3-bisphosphoglycerate-independent phosphoglycerate mutase
MAATPRILFVFLDGVGIGTSDPDVNPFAQANIPSLRKLMGGTVPTLDDPVSSGPGGSAFPLSATLGVDGLPQSGTGQAALLTGENAAALFGHHFGPWTPVRLRPLVRERSMLRRVADSGGRVAFANAYPRGWIDSRAGRRIAGPPLAAVGAGVLTRHVEALAAGAAVSSEIVNDAWKEKLGHSELPNISPAEAGAHLAKISGQNALTLYAHYATDTAGHRGKMSGGVAALERVDEFLGGVADQLDPDVLLLIASDHGNLENVTLGHTTNPVLGIASGPGAERASTMRDIRDICPFVLDMLDVPNRHPAALPVGT